MVAEVAPLAKAVMKLFQRRNIAPEAAVPALQMVLGSIIERRLTDDGAYQLDVADALQAAVFNQAVTIAWFAEGINRSRTEDT